MEKLTGLLSRFVHELRYEQLPAETVDHVRLFLMDYLAAATAGKRVNTVFNAAVEQYIFGQGGAEETTVLFGGRRLPCGKAAFMNACYAHGADMDDGNRKAMGHVGATVFSTVLALGETLGLTEQEMVTAAVAGYDVYCRVAAAAQPGLVHRGFHSTGTAGVIAAAAAAARLMELDEKGIFNAMAISVTMASGLMIVAESGQSIKPLNPAKAAECGVMAAALARDGVQGGEKPLESAKGWLHAMTDSVDETMVTDGLGERFCIDECYIKPYPSCRHTHCGMQAALELRQENGLSAENIQKVWLHIYPNAIQIAGQIRRPKTMDDSKFSIHYATACILALGRFGLEELNWTKTPDSVFALTERIELVPDESMENREAGIRGCRVVIETTDGRRLERTVLIPKGDPQNPYTWEDMRAKWSACADGFLSGTVQQAVYDRVRGFGKNEKFKEVCLK